MNARPSLTPMADAAEEGIAKMEADLAAALAKGGSDLDVIGVRFTQAMMPAFMRTFAKEVDAGADSEAILDALGCSLANIAASALGSIFVPESVPEAGLVFAKHFIANLRPRLNVASLPGDAIFRKEWSEPPAGHG